MSDTYTFEYLKNKDTGAAVTMPVTPEFSLTPTVYLEGDLQAQVEAMLHPESKEQNGKETPKT